jgi:hypothetical protein
VSIYVFGGIYLGCYSYVRKGGLVSEWTRGLLKISARGEVFGERTTVRGEGFGERTTVRDEGFGERTTVRGEGFT